MINELMYYYANWFRFWRTFTSSWRKI